MYLTLHKEKSSKGARPSRLLSLIMLLAGFFELIFSIVFTSSNLAFLGLGLIFFGAVLDYIRTDGYVKKVLLDATVISQVALNEVIRELGYAGQVIYLPPKYFDNPDTQKAYVSKQRYARLPTPEQIRDQAFLSSGQGILFTPSGAELTRLFERTLETNLVGSDFAYLQKNLASAFAELEIARNVEVKLENKTILVGIEDCRFVTPIENSSRSGDYCMPDSPISSAVACALAKVTGRPLMTLSQQITANGKNITIAYCFVDDL
jgi:hypothetical protein